MKKIYLVIYDNGESYEDNVEYTYKAFTDKAVAQLEADNLKDRIIANPDEFDVWEESKNDVSTWVESVELVD